jgi:hypothetical protein
MDKLKRREVPLVELRWRGGILQYRSAVQVVDLSGGPAGALRRGEWLDIPTEHERADP